MRDLLIKCFVKNYKSPHLSEVRTAYGVLTSTVGIICNILLFIMKLSIGLLINSISVTADAFNNLSDCISSIISLIGVRMAGKPADMEHPFGHGRIEYLSALIAAFLILQVGFSFFTNSFKEILTPKDLYFQPMLIILLLISIAVKLWLALFNRNIGTRINSKIMTAAALDATMDVITTTVTIVSILLFRFFGLNIDGYIGILVSLLILYAGFGIARDTLEPLIGSAPDPKLKHEIIRQVESHAGILGSHDLLIHNYGPGKNIASIHAEVASDGDIESVHEMIDSIERDVSKNLSILLVIHMDPINTKERT